MTEESKKIGPGPAKHAQRGLTKRVMERETEMLKEKETEPQGRTMSNPWKCEEHPKYTPKIQPKRSCPTCNCMWYSKVFKEVQSELLAAEARIKELEDHIEL